MGLIKGITVTLINKVKIGLDAFGAPIFEERPKSVDNVLVSPTSSQEDLDTFNLLGKKAVYTIAIPKGDNNVWQDQKVQFFGETWQVIGFPQRGIEDNIPLDWNDKWMVARYG